MRPTSEQRRHHEQALADALEAAIRRSKLRAIVAEGRVHKWQAEQGRRRLAKWLNEKWSA
jgi:hypothetical protein